MICQKCGRGIPDDAMLCCYCGRVIVKQAPGRVHQRGNGTGTAIRVGKTWKGQIVVGWRPNGDKSPLPVRKTRSGFRTRGEALAWCVSARQGLTEKPAAPDLAVYWDMFERGEYQQLSHSKQVAYAIAWRKLEPLARRRVNTLTVQDLRQTVDSAASSYYTARDMKTVLSHLFRLAGADGYADRDLPGYIILPELRERERTPFTDVEQAALWRLYESGDRRAAVPLVMIYTGMMPGEIQALRVDMIDFDARRITGVGLKTATRKASPVYLPDVIVPVLYEEAQHAGKNGYVWPHSEDRFYADYYAALAAAGCRRLEPYCCRHTTATALAITEGIAPQTVRKIMRWSTTKMLDRYAHPDDDDAAQAVNKIRRG